MIERRGASLGRRRKVAAGRGVVPGRPRVLTPSVLRSGALAVALGALLLSGLAFARATENEGGGVGPNVVSGQVSGQASGPPAWGASDRVRWEPPFAGGGAFQGDGGAGHEPPGPPRFPDCPHPPSRSSLERALRQTVRTFVAYGRARYGYQYRSLTYSYSIMSADIVDDQATVTISYSGSVQERLTGDTIDVSGEASADYAWTACHWVNTGITY